MKIAVLAVQGAFIEHERKLEVLGASCVELRKAEDLNQSYDGLVLPGGESTVQGKLLRELGMFDTIRIPMTFIRAPYVSEVSDGVEVLAVVEDRVVAVRYGKQIALAFHPELDEDHRVHEEFLRMCGEK